MRKLAIFSVLLMAVGGAFTVFSPVFADDGCSLTTNCSKADEYINFSNTQCLECDTDSCPGSTIIVTDVGTVDGNKSGTGIWVCRAKTGLWNSWSDDHWMAYTPDVCDGSLSDSIEGVIKEFKSKSGNAVVATVIANGAATKYSGDFCVNYKCPKDKAVSVDGTKCVSSSENAEQQKKADCEKRTDKEWKNGRCVCKTPGYDDDGTTCIDKNARDQAALICTKGGATGIYPNCVCKSGYSWNDTSKKCEITQEESDRRRRDAATAKAKRKAACDAAAGTKWDNDKPANKECSCTDLTRNWDGKECVVDAKVAACNQTEGAAWNLALGKCDCEQPGYEIVGKKCVEGADKRQEREDESRRKQEQDKKDQDASTTKIRNALSQISTMRTSYESDASVWKTGDGKFNTSRLVSDSVAGVVLGTAGGLITSSVIKKNQIKGGFEDISCTIGGQVVSDWGDEFTVGIR